MTPTDLVYLALFGWVVVLLARCMTCDVVPMIREAVVRRIYRFYGDDAFTLPIWFLFLLNVTDPRYRIPLGQRWRLWFPTWPLPLPPLRFVDPVTYHTAIRRDTHDGQWYVIRTPFPDELAAHLRHLDRWERLMAANCAIPPFLLTTNAANRSTPCPIASINASM